MADVEIKICGLVPGDDLSFLEDGPITHIGIILVPASRRYVPPMTARQITSALPDRVKAVGVFANTDRETVLSQAQIAGLDIVQLHGHESPEDCQWLTERGAAVWKAIPVPTDAASPEETWERIALYKDVVHGILLDAKAPAKSTITGGHGQTFDWRVLRTLAPRLAGYHWWVAGGITPENVQELLACVQPVGIDVSSGVEVALRKNIDRIQKLLKVVDGR